MKIAILGSGTGSNAKAILEAQEQGHLGGAQVVGIISDHADALILELGKRYGVPAVHIDSSPFKTKLLPETEQAYVQQIRDWGADLVVLAGFMRVIKNPLLNAFPSGIINLHPSLLPKYPGLNSVKRALEAGDSEAGCTVHWVNAVVDGGEILRQSVVKIEAEDTFETLMEKVHSAEHALLPAVIRELSMREK